MAAGYAVRDVTCDSCVQARAGLRNSADNPGAEGIAPLLRGWDLVSNIPTAPAPATASPGIRAASCPGNLDTMAMSTKSSGFWERCLLEFFVTAGMERTLIRYPRFGPLDSFEDVCAFKDIHGNGDEEKMNINHVSGPSWGLQLSVGGDRHVPNSGTKEGRGRKWGMALRLEREGEPLPLGSCRDWGWQEPIWG